MQQGCSESPFDNSLQNTMLGQMTPQDLQIFSSASDWVTAGAIWDAVGIVSVFTSPAVPVIYTQARAVLIGIQVGVSTFLAAEPGLVQFANDLGTGYAKWEDAIPGYPSNLTQWIGFGAGALVEWAQYGFPTPW